MNACNKRFVEHQLKGVWPLLRVCRDSCTES